MQRTHVVLLPERGFDRQSVAAELVGAGIDCYLPELGEIADDLPPQLADARRVASIAQWLGSAKVEPPLLLVACGTAARLLPALSLSQRSSARLVVGYVVVDALSPAPSHEWPDAPVWWVATPGAPADVSAGALSADLRGFEVLSEVAVVPAIVRAMDEIAGRGA